MYERMLNKQETPSLAEMTSYCCETAGLFSALNEWLTATYATAQQITFPYGNQYGWGIAHRLKKKLICNIFAENNSFTVMVRLSGNQFQSLYTQLQKYTQEYIDNQYPCGDGGWIQDRVPCKEHFDDIQKILAAKCS